MKHRKRKHIIETYLDYIDLQYTKIHLKELLSNNPDPNTFAGIRNILLDYKIDSKGLKLSVRELYKISDPVIVQLKGDIIRFILLIKSDNNQWFYISDLGSVETINFDKLVEEWTGFALFPEVTKESKEERYYQNMIVEFSSFIKNAAILITFTITAIWFFLRQGGASYSKISFFILYFIGIIACILLTAQSLGIDNHLTRKICEIGKKTSCNSVLNSKGAKLFNLIGWSEIGLIYFTGSLFALVFMPESLSILFWLNILSLPYSFWSIIYQHFVVKKWCMLCLTIQLTFWVLFIAFISNSINLYDFTISDDFLISFITCFIIPALSIWFILPKCKKTNQYQSLLRNYNKIKINETVFDILLKKQRKLVLSPIAKSLSIGNRNASITITIISNPYCGHCAIAHKRLMLLFERFPNEFKVQFVFVGDDFMESSIKFLIAVYLQYEEQKVIDIYKQWYDREDRIFNDYTVDTTATDVCAIYTAQRELLKEKRLTGTPAIYFNDHELPEYYTVEEIRYFI